MTKKISTLDELFVEELGDLLSAETQLVKALPKMAEATQSRKLKSALEDHLSVTKRQVNRLEEIFKELGQKAPQMTCKAMKGIIEESNDVVKDTEDECAARDAAIIGAAQRAEHYEIAGYGTARCHASLLGHKKIEGLLEETLREEKDADHKLNEIAENSINEDAMTELDVE